MNQEKMTQDFHLRGLNGLRAIAAVTVVVGHIELIKNKYQITNILENSRNWGGLAVMLFFVLSGFLITTLLLRQKESTSKINLKNFYWKRILRIWPLYFIILISSALIFNYSPSWITLTLCSTIFPNVAHTLGYGWSVSPQIWSIGVEEQFYLLWPAVLKLKQKTILTICILFIFAYPLLPHIISFVTIRLGVFSNSWGLLGIFITSSSFNSLATGAFFSIIYFNKNKGFIKFIRFSKWLNFTLIFLPFILLFANVDFLVYHSFIYSLLFGLQIILIIDGNLTNLFEFRVLDFLGQISYGIYMYHWIILLLIFNTIKLNFSSEPIMNNFILYLGTIGGTILIAYLSFKFLESPILKLKSKFP